jgi:hypothetical protein
MTFGKHEEYIGNRLKINVLLCMIADTQYKFY